MKHAVLSIIVAVLGMVWVVYLNHSFAEAIMNYSDYPKGTTLSDFNLKIPNFFKMSGLIIGLIGIFFGIKGFFKTKLISIVGIVLNILLIILTFMPIYTYILSNSGYDINIS
ncbi:MAG: hypothetical protein Aureis2KO_28660 [Aureisphaera sp.]